MEQERAQSQRLLASELGFREIVGVELNPPLAATAKTNADLWTAAGKARSPIRIEQGDAADFVWPSGPCVIFLFNPFGATVMKRVLDRLANRLTKINSEAQKLKQK